MEDCKHRNVSAEDAGFEVEGVRQVVAVCHDCGAAAMHADTVPEAYAAFWNTYPEALEGE